MLLRPLLPTDEREARQAHAELAAEGFPFLLGLRPGDVEDEPWPDLLARVDRERQGDVPEGRVPATFLVGEVEGHLVARVSVRHALSPALAEVGGHIGYAVRPAWRRRGYATRLLRHALPVARGAGVDPALLTCDDTNTASARAIERCGGVFERLARTAPHEPVSRRYWVPTGS